jgi:methylphosphotriester-DNA--protein-cysteine methyltransferase
MHRTRGAVSGRVQSLLGARLRGEVPSLASIAAELAMSERSVQRSLSEESTSYREIVDEVRKGLALSHLSRPGSTATDVAFLLGFSDQRLHPRLPALDGRFALAIQAGLSAPRRVSLSIGRGLLRRQADARCAERDPT